MIDFSLENEMNTTPSPKPMRLRSQAALLGLVVAVGMAGCNANTSRKDHQGGAINSPSNFHLVPS